MPEAVINRPAVREDLHLLSELPEAVFSVEDCIAADTARLVRGLDMMLDNDRGRILAAGADKTVVGTCVEPLMTSKAEGGPAVLMKDVVVREDRRDQGIGWRPVKAIHDWDCAHAAGGVQPVGKPEALTVRFNL